MKIVTVEQMQNIEKSADAQGLSYQQMMKNAGWGIARWLMNNVPLNVGVFGLVGSGNNGGDTLIALTELAKRGVRTLAYIVKTREEGDPLIADYLNFDGDVIDLSNHSQLNILNSVLAPGAVLLDGILGTGLKLPLRRNLHHLMGMIRQLVENRSEIVKIAVDCPSGIDCDTGEVSDVCFYANHTLCMAAVKQGLLKFPGRSFTGELHWVDIGLEHLANHVEIKTKLPILMNESFVKKNLPKRQPNAHKGTYGTSLVIAGTRSFTGAAFLTGKAAYRAGCGLVRIATIEPVYQSLAGHLVEAVWTILPDSDGHYSLDGLDKISKALPATDSVVIGPGWGVSDINAEFLERLLVRIPPNMPILLDADGLKLLKKIDSWWEKIPAQTVLTPHPGEFSILTGIDIETIQTNRWELAYEFAKKWSVTLVLKGAMTVVVSPKGEQFINPVCDSALATAGSGDVLSGMVGGFLAQGLTAKNAALAGVWLHSQAGLSAKRKLGTEISVTALDILEGIPDAFIKLQ